MVGFEWWINLDQSSLRKQSYIHSHLPFSSLICSTRYLQYRISMYEVNLNSSVMSLLIWSSHWLFVCRERLHRKFSFYVNSISKLKLDENLWKLLFDRSFIVIFVLTPVSTQKISEQRFLKKSSNSEWPAIKNIST